MLRFAVLVISAGVLSAQTSESPQELLKQAIAEHQAGKLADAVRDYRTFLDMYPDVVQVRSNLGAALAAQGQYQEAIVECQQALALASREPDAHRYSIEKIFPRLGETDTTDDVLKLLKGAPAQ